MQIENLVKIYPGPVTALQGINLEIPPGMFGLLGPNGAGKTTLMRIISGVLEPTSGKIFHNGVDIVENPSHIWSRLGYLPQEFGFYPNLTGTKMLIHLLSLKGIQHPKGLKYLAEQLLERVNLTFAAKRKLKTYSGGMRQRLGIAQTIAGNPQVIIVDEPTAGLDPEERLRFYRILSELAQDRVVILSTHIVDDVSVLCPSFAVIREGQVLTLTNPTQARNKLKEKMFEGSVTLEQQNIVSQKWQITQSLIYEGQNKIRIHDPEQQPPEGFYPVHATLEDAYLVMMQNGHDNPLKVAQ